MNLASGKTLNGRYQILAQLGKGGFGETFLSQDQHLPNQPHCVVKQLKPQFTSNSELQIARRLFETEAQILHKLGNHPQIPQLFAYFAEKQEFYLVQEYIEGDELSKEFPPGTTKSEADVITLLQEILEILVFVHEQNVIHRDINLNNILRRKADGKLVLIDFGAVKQLTTQLVQESKTNYTVAVGTPGYMPSEQALGFPKFSSDVYAVGMIGIQVLTGCLPYKLLSDPDTGEISWHHLATVTPGFTSILDKMTRYDFRQRYPTATEALKALQTLQNSPSATAVLPKLQKPLFSQLSKSLAWLYRGLIAASIAGIVAGLTIIINQFINTKNAINLSKNANTLYQLKSYQEAINYYNKSLEINPEYQEAWRGKGDALKALKQYNQALKVYEKAIQLAPNDWQCWLGRAQVLEDMGKSQEALDSFNRTISINPNAWEAWQGKSQIQMKLSQYAESLESLDKLLRLKSDNYWDWYNKGWALQNLKEYKEALKSYDKALELKPDFTNAWYQKANLFLMLQQYQDAVNSYDKAVQFNPGFAQGWYSKGITLTKLGRNEEAINAFAQATQAKSNYYEAWYQKGWLLHQTKRYREAVTAYQQAIRLKPQDYQVWYSQGNALYNLGEYQQAIAVYQKAVKLKPDAYQAWKSLGNGWFNLKGYEAAIAAYNQALRYKSDYQEAIEGKAQAQRLLDLEKAQKVSSNSEQ
jgi:tetratricopeptide (TPR) repeat protein